jgi:hypothetical protein
MGQVVVDLDLRAIGEPGVGLGARVRDRSASLASRVSSVATFLSCQRVTDVEDRLLARFQAELDPNDALRVGTRPGAIDRRRPPSTVEPDRLEVERFAAGLPDHLSLGRGQEPANLEHRLEVGVAAQLHFELDGLPSM